MVLAILEGIKGLKAEQVLPKSSDDSTHALKYFNKQHPTTNCIKQNVQVRWLLDKKLIESYTR